MNYTTSGDAPAGLSRPFSGPARIVTAAAVVAVAIALGLGLGACGAGDDQPAPAAGAPSASPGPTGTADLGTPATGDPTPGDTGGDGTGDGDGGGNGGTGDGDGPPGEPGGQPPTITYPDGHAYFDGGQLVADVFGHAYDLDGPDDQRRVERLEVQWGDGTTTTARLEGHGAFRDYHEYESYEGRTITVRIVAYGHDGQTASETITIDLPE